MLLHAMWWNSPEGGGCVVVVDVPLVVFIMDVVVLTGVVVVVVVLTGVVVPLSPSPDETGSTRKMKFHDITFLTF